MVQPLRAHLPRLLAALATLAFAFVLTTCGDEAAGPARRRASIAIQPVFAAPVDLAAFNLTIDNVRLIVVRPPADVVLDTTIAFAANQDSVELRAQIDLQQSPETFQVTLELRSGTQVLFAGTQDVSVFEGQATVPTLFFVTYAGPGQNVATLTLDPIDSVLSFGASLTFRPTARDAQGNVVPSFYVSWTTSDPAGVPIDAAGTITAPATRRIVTVQARTLPNDVTAITPITFIPVPTAINLVSGCGQTGLAGVQLPQPVVVRVVAADLLGVKGIPVLFTPPPGGAVSPAQVVTDAAGLAQTLVTLGPAPGPASFSIGASGVSPVTCNQTVQGLVTQLVFTTQPTGNIVAGTSLGTIVVTARDAIGQTDATFTGSVTLALGANLGGVTFGSPTVSAVAGVATFSNVGSIDKTGAGYTLVATSGSLTGTSAPFNVIPAAPAQLAFTVQPSAALPLVPIVPPVAIAVQDAFGNLTPASNSVTIAIGNNPTGAVLGGTATLAAVAGVATFADLTFDRVGSGYTLTASSPGLTSATSDPFDVNSVTGVHLAFATQPGNIAAGSIIAPPVMVTALDGQNNPIPSFTDNVTLSLGSCAVGTTLLGTPTIAAIAGVATFADLSLDKAGTCTLVAASGTLPPVTSATFTVTAGAATQLAFVTQPATVTQGGIILPPVQVGVRDQFGNPVLTATDVVTIAIGNNPGSATLGGILNQAALAGIATFADLTLSAAGTGYTLVASATGLGTVQSAPFGVLPLISGIAWNNPAGGSWSLAANWLPARVPAKGDTVFITLPGIYTVTLDVNDTVSFLTLGGATGTQTLAASSRTLGIDSSATVLTNGTLTLANTTINGGSALSNSGTVLVSPGTSVINATVAVITGGLLRLNGNNGDASLTVSSGLTNQGTVELTGSSWSGRLTVAGGSLANLGTLRAVTGVSNFFAGELDNPGTVQVDGPLTISGTSAAHTNSGAITLGAGNLTLNQSGTTPSFTTTGSVVVGAGRVLQVNGGVFDYASASPGGLAGLGTVSFTAATLGLTPDFTHDTLAVTLTSSVVNGPGTLRVAGPTVLPITQSTINAALDNLGTIQAAPGANMLNGAVTNGSGALLRLNGNNGDANVIVATGFTNLGTIELTGTSWSGRLTVTSGALVNDPVGTLRAVAGAANLFNGTLDNQGTVQVDGPLTISGTSANHTNSGAIILGAGNLTLAQSGPTPSFTTTGSVVVGAGRVLQVNNGSFNYANVSPGGLAGLGTVNFSFVALALTPDLTHDTLAVTLSNSLVNGPGMLRVAGATVLPLTQTTINAPLDNLGTIQATPGTNTWNGAVTNRSGALLRLNGNNGDANVTVATGFTNLGAIELTGSSWSGRLTVTSGALVNDPAATLRVLAGAANSFTGTLDNRGTVQVGGPLTINGASADHLNSGTITLGAGNLTVTQSGTTPSFATTGQVTVGAGRTWSVSGGALDYAGGAIEGTGTLALSGVTLGLGVGLTHDTLLVSLSNSTVNGPGTLTVAGTSTVTLTGTTVNAPFVNQGTVQAAPGSNAFTGTVANQSGALLRLNGNNGDANVTVATGFTNLGAIELTGSSWSGRLTVTSGALVNDPAATLRALAGAANSFTGTLDNRGTVQVDGPLTINGVSADHTNSGTITLGAGNLTITQTGTTPSLTTTGRVTLGAARTWSLSGGALGYAAGVIEGTGTLALNGVTLGLGVSLTHDTLLVSPTNSTVNGPGTLTVAGTSTLTLTGTTVNAPFVNQGTVQATPGTNVFNGSVANGSGALLQLHGNNGDANVTVATGFTNLGTIELTGTSWSGRLTVTSGALVNDPVGTLRAVAGAANSFTGTLDNQGTVQVDGPLTISGVSADHTNSGTITLGAGNLTITQSGTTPSFANNGLLEIGAAHTVTVTGGSLTNNAAGTLGGSGTLNVAGTTFSNAGSVNPGTSPGILTVTGAFPAVSGSVLNIELGGLTAGTQHDRLAVSGQATLGGVLNVTLISGFVPGASDQFTILTYGSQTANFATVNLPPGMQLSVGPTSVVVSVVGGSTPVNSWINSGGGNWNTSTNWSTAVVPAAGDSVVIDLSGTYTVTLDVSPIVAYLTVGGGSGLQTLSATSRTLTVNGALVVNGSGAVILNSSTLAGVGSLVNQGSMNVTSSTINLAADNQGTLIVHGTSAINGSYSSGTGSILRMEGNQTQGSAVLTVAAGFTNNGGIELTNADPVSQRTAQLNVTAGTLVNPATRTIAALVGTNGGTRVLNAQWNNQGTLSVASAQGMTSTTAGTALANSGTIDLSGGSLTISQSGTSSLAHSGTIQLTGGSFSLSQGAGGTLTTTGAVTIGTGRTFTVTGGIFNVNTGSSITGGGALALTSTTANLTPNFDNGLTTLTLNGSTVNGPGTLTNTTGKTLVLLNSTLGATLPFINQSTVIVNGASAINGSYTSGTGSTLRMEGNQTQGSAVLTVATGFINNGAIELTNADPVSQRTAQLNVTAGTLVNPATGTIAGLVGTTGGTRVLNAQWNNQGTLAVASAQGLTSTTAGTTLANSGTIDLSGGSLTINQSGTSTLVNSGTIQLTGGSFSLSQGAGGTVTTTGGISIGTGRTFTVTGGTFNVNTSSSITGAGTLALTSTTANFTPNFDNGLTGLTVSSSTVNGPGTLTNTTGKTLVLLSSTLGANLPFINQGTVVVNGTSAINGSYSSGTGSTLRTEGNQTQGSAVLTVAAGFTNNGAIELTNADPVSQRTAQLNVTTGTLVNPVTRTISGLVGTNGGTRVLNAQWNNQGTLSVASALGMTSTTAGTALANSGTIDLSGGSLTINQSGTSSLANSGTIQLTGGSFSLSQGAGGTVTTTGGISIGTGRTFTVTGGIFNVNTGSSITGAGTLALTSTTANFTPNFTNSLTGLTVSSSTVNGPGTLTNATGKTLLLLSSTLGATLPVVNQGMLVVNGTSVINGSYSSGTGSTLRMEGNQTQGSAVLTVATGFTNNGAIELTNADPVSQRTAQLNVTTGTLVNPATRTISGLVGTNGGTRVLNAQWNNQGTLSVASAQGLTSTTAGTTLANSGTIDLSGGSFTITQTGTSSLTNSGTIQLVGGSFSLSQGAGGTLTTTGAVSIGAGRTVTVTGGVLTISTGATITGSGTLALSSATANVTPNFNTGLTGLTLLSSIWNGPGTLTNPLGRTLNLQSSTIGAPFVNGGTVVATGTSALTGTVTTSAGDSIIVQGNGTFGTGTLTVSGGDVTNNGAIVLTDIVSSYGATLTVSNGLLTNPPGATIEALLGTGGDRTINAALDNQGSLKVGTAAARRLTIAPPAGAELNNSGTITVNSGTLQATMSGAYPYATNQGTITLSGGDFALTQPSGATPGLLATPGSLVIGSGRTFSVTGGGFQVPLNGSITGAGTLALAGDSAFVTPAFNTGSTRLSLLNSVWLGSDFLTNASGVTLNLQNSEIAGPLQNEGTLVATGTSVLSGGVGTTSGSTIQVEGNGTFGAATLQITSGWTNSGSIKLTSVTSSYGATLAMPSGTLANDPISGTIDVLAGTGGARVLNAQLDNQGLMTVDAPLTLNKTSAQHINGGTLNVAGGDVVVQLATGGPSFTNQGMLAVGAGRKFTVTGGGAFLNASSARIQGQGTVDVSGAVPTNAGFIFPGGQNTTGFFTWTGNLPEQASALLQFDIEGVTPGTQYDRLVVSGMAFFNGTLDVSVSGPAPPPGQVFTLMTYAPGGTGAFQTVSVPNGWSLNIGATALTVTAP